MHIYIYMYSEKIDKWRETEGESKSDTYLS